MKRCVVAHGDSRMILRRAPDRSVQMAVTSIPYYNLRAYEDAPEVPLPNLWWGGDPECPHLNVDPFVKRGISGGTGRASRKRAYSRGKTKGEGDPNFQIVPDQEQAYCRDCGAWLGQWGQEPTPEEYVDHTVEVFEQVRRVLKDDGTLWLNIADTWAGSGKGKNGNGVHGKCSDKQATNAGVLNLGIIPSSVPTGMKAKDVMDIPGMVGDGLRAAGWYWRSKIIWYKPNAFPEGGVYDRPYKCYEYIHLYSKGSRYLYDRSAVTEVAQDGTPKFLRDVWIVPNETSHLNHYASFPTELPRRCILFGSNPGDLVLDPACGIGRTGKAALLTGRRFLGVDLSRQYVGMARKYLAQFQEGSKTGAQDRVSEVQV